MLSQAELSAGAEYWRSTKWPQDFHNSFYEEMAAKNPAGQFNDAWWSDFLRTLTAWKATRGKKHAFLTDRAQQRFSQLGLAWHTDCEPITDDNIASLSWDQVAPFTSLVAEIKDVKSPVFTSKFCHFLLPQVFPVVDNAAMGNRFRTYRPYFEFAQGEWGSTPHRVQDDLEAELRAAVPAMFNAYPVKTKLIELCLIGRRHPST